MKRCEDTSSSLERGLAASRGVIETQQAEGDIQLLPPWMLRPHIVTALQKSGWRRNLPKQRAGIGGGALAG